MRSSLNHTPAYFNQHYGIDDEVYRFCQNVYMYFKDKEYSDTLHTIGISPVAQILLTKKMILKAVKKIKSKGKFDYDAFERDFDAISLI